MTAWPFAIFHGDLLFWQSPSSPSAGCSYDGQPVVPEAAEPHFPKTLVLSRLPKIELQCSDLPSKHKPVPRDRKHSTIGGVPWWNLALSFRNQLVPFTELSRSIISQNPGFPICYYYRQILCHLQLWVCNYNKQSVAMSVGNACEWVKTPSSMPCSAIWSMAWCSTTLVIAGGSLIPETWTHTMCCLCQQRDCHKPGYTHLHRENNALRNCCKIR